MCLMSDVWSLLLWLGPLDCARVGHPLSSPDCGGGGIAQPPRDRCRRGGWGFGSFLRGGFGSGWGYGWGCGVSRNVSRGSRGADRRLVWPTRVGICAVWGVCLCDCVGRRPYVSLRCKSVSVLSVADSCFVRGYGKSWRLNQFVFHPATPKLGLGPIVVSLRVT